MEPMDSAQHTSLSDPATGAARRPSKSKDRGSGFPHSEISGSKGARTSPELIAACHVLLRLPTPRHPSEALMRLIVLSKTHARGPSRRAYGLRSSLRQTMSSLDQPSKRTRRRADPSFTMSTHPALGAGRELVAFLDRATPQARGNRWWSRTGSNRRPHACKARALPTELRPLQGEGARPGAASWWAQADSNRRPHAYQACALTS